MLYALSMKAAAKLCGVGEAAIRRAFHEDRITPSFFWVHGKMQIPYFDLDSVIRCYSPDYAHYQAILESLEKFEFKSPDGRSWCILDTHQPLMYFSGEGTT